MNLPPEVHARMRELTTKLVNANNAYYVLSAPTLSDADYDKLSRELANLETATGFSFPESPTRLVGSDLSGSFQKVKHKFPMLSLDNVFSHADVTSFFKSDFNVVVEPKFDGVSLSLEYEAGELKLAKTRGNGEEGEDVTANARTILGIPLKLHAPITSEIRGEVLMRRQQLQRLNVQREAEGETPFANCRNAASGTLKQKSPAEVAKRKLNFVAYQLLGHDLAWADTHVKALHFLKTAGFSTPLSFLQVAPVAVSACMEHVNAIQAMKASIDIDLDGAVIKVNSLQSQEDLGLKTKSPRWGCAYKFPPEEVTTILEAIELTVGKTGQICPNARLKPVQLEGVTVSNASLMNYDEMERIGSPAPGDEVVVVRSAAVIPRVTSVKAKCGKTWSFPTTCPTCTTPLQRDGVHYFCPNHVNCKSQVFARLQHAVAKYALDWDGLGESTLWVLYANGNCRFLSDLLAITDEQADALLKPSAAKKFKIQRETVKKAPLWRQLVALGIEGIGQTSSKELAAKYPSLEALMSTNLAELTELLGPVAAQSVHDYLLFSQEPAKLKALGMEFKADIQAGPLSGKSFVITGTLMAGSREQVAAWLESLGATMKSSVGKTTSYLVVGESPGGNKTEAAAKYGTTTLSEAALYELVGQQPSFA